MKKILSVVALLLAMVGILWPYIHLKDYTWLKFWLNLEPVKLAALLLLLFKTIGWPFHANNIKDAHEKAFPQYIQNVLFISKKLERKFFSAVDDFTRDKYAASLTKLEDLQTQWQHPSELFVISVFTALCLDRMGLYEEAIVQYQHAMRIRPNSSLASNMGMCQEQLDCTEKAEEYYKQAISMDPKNVDALTNLGFLQLQDGDIKTALRYALDAVKAGPRMPHALALATICCGLLDRQEEYRHYCRRATAEGYEEAAIEAIIQAFHD